MKRRARRRLVGAIALVVLVVIALPIVLDREPKPVSQDLSIQIPSQDAGRFSSRVLPAQSSVAPAAPATPSADAVAKPAPVAEVVKPEAAKPETKAADTKAAEVKPAAPKAEAPVKPAAPEAKAESKPATTAAAAAMDGSFVVPLGLFSKADNIKQVRAKAESAGFKTYTEVVAGTDGVRVRAGPFASRDAAEQARDKLKGAGLDVGAVAAR